MDAIAGHSGSLSRALQLFRQEANGADAAGGHRRRARPVETGGAQRVHQGRRNGELEEAGKPARVASDPQAASAAALSYRRAEGTSLFIKTQEGDTIELKIRSRESGAIQAAQMQDGEQTLTAVQQQTQSSTRISLAVKGDLNEEELAAIRNVVEQADALAQQFFENDVAGAFAAAASLQMDGAQLASVGFSLSLHEQLTYTEKSYTRPASAPAMNSHKPAAAPAQVAAHEPAAGAQTPTAATLAPSATPTPDARPAPPALADPLSSIRQFLSQLMDKMSAPVAGPQLDMALKIRIFQSVVTTAATAQPAAGGQAAPLPALVPETLDALAAQQQPPLRTLA